jgi:hypothetical protein
MALLSQKTLQFVRAPDENVFIARTLFTLPIFVVIQLTNYQPSI